MKKYFCYVFCLLIVTSTYCQNNRWVVAKDGSGDFTTVQAAINALPKGGQQRITIYVKKGVYEEKLLLDSLQSFVSLVGEDKFNTVLTFNDHTGKKAADGSIINTRTSYSFLIKANNFRAENITFQNNAGFTAGQAVAVEVQGDKVSFFNCRFIGNQDVLFTNAPTSRVYLQDCYIEGTTDFIFGAATVWFQRCHIHSKKNSHVTAASTPKENLFGYVFYDCILTADTAINNVSLGRPWRPYASVTYLYCFLGRHIMPDGWDNWKNVANEKTARYAEWASFGPGATKEERVPWSRQLTAIEVNNYTLKKVFPDWDPLQN